MDNIRKNTIPSASPARAPELSPVWDELEELVAVALAKVKLELLVVLDCGLLDCVSDVDPSVELDGVVITTGGPPVGVGSGDNGLSENAIVIVQQGGSRMKLRFLR